MPGHQRDENPWDKSYPKGPAKNDFDRFIDLNADNDQLHSGWIKGDEELEKVVKELLHNSHKLDARDITVTVDKGNVTLSGTVRTQEDRDYATSLVKLVHGVGDIKSEIIVKRNQGILPTDIGRNP